MKITPDAVAKMLKWDLGDIADFCADTLEAANDHDVAQAMRAIAEGYYGSAIEFIELAKEVDMAGELTPELKDRREQLMRELEKAREEDGGEEEDEDA